ncbi:protein-disulfide reductase DsbD [Shewanella intestini]|uniref:Thiol:disulfide interchange protein DsbD n=1 Tax=Shewanella intestini TaxID=2017544 RepID=A0ABS5I6C0_9GAMM|nr:MULTISPECIES: protein-disulfide reductase DsbD [Shewanella]MBR9729577.1 protein-disulfide reductase DsbD [Shewanella intestini]MRG37647.1 protein-disulfide reductase DsbD [Shewanella sp. XMDDZSB0408]
MKKLLATVFTSLLLLSSIVASPAVYSAGSLSSKFSFLNDEPELMPVDKAFVFDYKQQGNQLKLSWIIADGYYMYRDKLQFAVDGAVIGDIAVPKGKMHHDDYFGDQEVYHAFVDIPVGLKEASKGSTFTVTFMGCAQDKLCFPPTKNEVPLESVAANDGKVIAKKVIGAPQSASTSEQSASAPVTEQDTLNQMLQNDSLLWTLLVFFGLGIGLALTPCVFPMYPILSGIIVGQGKQLSTAKAFTLSMAYVQGMAITYSLLGLVVASAGMKFQAALQHPAILIFLAVMFVLLSLSMFGMYELRLPGKWQDKMNTLSNNQKGGNLVGVFMMGVISGLVASPCTTAPLSGALIYVAQSGDLLQGFLALYVLSMGMGVPLLVIGTSGGKLLPRAGAWMDIIKTVFGFLLISVSIVMIGRIWPGLVSDILWSLWGIALVGYLMHQNKLTQFNWKQTVRSVLLLLSLLASFSYGLQAIMGAMGHQSVGMSATSGAVQKAAHPEFVKIKSLEDLELQLDKASVNGQTVMLDLYADWCVACKEFEHITFADPMVIERLNKMVILQADVTKSDATDVALLEHYSVLGLPTLLMFDENGKQREDLRVTGFMKPQAFADHLDLLLKK